ncbi:TraK family protein [Pseudomonas cavernicola]|uniref:TraK family protein n=1 Tax=Pseudomonas cavernicola TaxID=2320866 RepID=UPI001313E19A
MQKSAAPHKPLTIRIAEKVLADSPDHPLRHRAEFVLALDEVKEALKAGHSVRAIWRVLHEEGNVNCTYQAFRCSVNNLILSRPEGPDGQRPRYVGAAMS